jgi:hypothetical protein
VQVISVAGGDGEVEFLFQCLFPGGDDSADVIEEFGDALEEIGSAGSGEDDLDPRV